MGRYMLVLFSLQELLSFLNLYLILLQNVSLKSDSCGILEEFNTHRERSSRKVGNVNKHIG